MNVFGITIPNVVSWFEFSKKQLIFLLVLVYIETRMETFIK